MIKIVEEKEIEVEETRLKYLDRKPEPGPKPKKGGVDAEGAEMMPERMGKDRGRWWQRHIGKMWENGGGGTMRER